MSGRSARAVVGDRGGPDVRLGRHRVGEQRSDAGQGHRSGKRRLEPERDSSSSRATWRSSRRTTARTGIELWKTDGTPAGTALVKDINPGADELGSERAGCARRRGVLPADDGTHGRRAVEEQRHRGGNDDGQGHRPRLGRRRIPPAWSAFNGDVYFSATDARQRRRAVEVRRHRGGHADGEGHRLWIGRLGSVLASTVAGGKLFFAANDACRAAVSCGRPTARAAGTTMVRNIVPGERGLQPAGACTRFGGDVYFAAEDGHPRLRAVEERRHVGRNQDGQGHVPGGQNGSNPNPQGRSWAATST